MKIALNGATTMHANLATDIEAASVAGYDLLEIWAPKLRAFLKANTLQDLKQLLWDNRIEPYSINSIEHVTFRNTDEYERIKLECSELTSIAGEIGCPHVVVVPGKLPPGKGKDDVVVESVRVLDELGKIAAKNGVSLAFEFLGQTDCSVQTLELASEIVNAVGSENIGLVLDTFHFYAGNSTLESIQEIDPKKLFIFHINDAENLEREQLTDANRLYPGKGILPLKEIIVALKNIGYDWMVSVEIFRPEYWEMNAFEVARKARDATIEVLNLKTGSAGQ
ncbi:MAG: sugar phosphate isomerase/epimerase family protein [Pyrinomonadaceae bacterium]